MKILGLCASQRKLGNSEIILKEILSRFPERDEKAMIRLTDLKINPCTACYACLPQEKPCVLNDDFQFLLNQIQSAHLIVIVSPVYFLGIHNSLKMIQDRFISVLNKGSLFSGKKCLLALPYGVHSWEGNAFSQLNAFAHFLHLDICGSLLIQAANPGEAGSPENLTKIEAMLERFQSGNQNLNKADHLHSCPECGADVLQFFKNGKIRCVFCNLEGQMTKKGNELLPDFTLFESTRFSLKGMKSHADHLEEIKKGFLENRQQLGEIRKPYRKYDEWWIKP